MPSIRAQVEDLQRRVEALEAKRPAAVKKAVVKADDGDDA